MICDLLKALAESGLLTATYLQMLQKSGVDVGEAEPSASPINHHKIDGFYGVISRLGHFNVDTTMTIAEEWLSDVNAPQSYGEGVSAYDVLRHRLLLGGSEKFMVIYGSLSGIQNYLFDVKSSQALKQLRGRSFYLYLLQDAVVERAIQYFNVSRQSVLYSTGGTFCMLVPYDDGVEERFRQFKSGVTDAIFNKHQQNLILLNYQIASLSDFNENMSDVFSALHIQKNRDKYSPMCHNLREKYAEYFTPRECRSISDISEAIELGANIGKMKYVLISPTKVDADALMVVEPGGLGLKYHLLSSLKYAIKANDTLSLIVFNDIEIPNVPIGCRREYLAGIGAVAQSFTDLLEDSDGVKRLGVLRMDVDNLGSVLRKSYSSRHAMIHFARMSRKLDRFFKKQLNEIWQKSYKDSSVIVYSGGDDLFIAGEWVSVLDFAQTITNQYKTFFADKDFTISGGISLVDEKFPIIRAAEYSAEEESRAKQFCYTSRKGEHYTKNALSIFGSALRWDVEMPVVMEIYNTLYGLKTTKEKVWNPIIRRVLNYYDAVKIVDRMITPVDYIWLMTYDLSRLRKRQKSDPDNQVIDDLVKDITTGVTIMGRNIDSPYHSLHLWAIAARLVELQTR